MLVRSLVLTVAALVLGVSPPISNEASAAGVQATITTLVDNETGVGSGSFQLFLNNAPLPVVAQQTVMLGAGDELRAVVLTEAMFAGSTSSFNYRVTVDLLLDDQTAAAMFRTAFSGIANAFPEIAQSSASSVIDCDFLNTGCSAPALPPSTFFTSGVTSSTVSILPNSKLVNNVGIETGNVGGVESLTVITNLTVDRQLGPPSAGVDAGALALAITDSFATTSATLQVAVTDLTPIPVPAALWLFGSALGLLGWRFQRQ